MKLRYKLEPDAITAKDTVKDVTMLLAAWAFIYGFVTVLGGDPVWMIPAYRAANTVPYSPESWGYALMLVSVGMFTSMFTGRRRLMIWSLYAGGLWNMVFMYALGYEYFHVRIEHINSPGVGFGPVMTYLLISILFLSRTSTYRGKNAAPTDTP